MNTTKSQEDFQNNAITLYGPWGKHLQRCNIIDHWWFILWNFRTWATWHDISKLHFDGTCNTNLIVWLPHIWMPFIIDFVKWEILQCVETLVVNTHPCGKMFAQVVAKPWFWECHHGEGFSIFHITKYLDGGKFHHPKPIPEMFLEDHAHKLCPPQFCQRVQSDGFLKGISCMGFHCPFQLVAFVIQGVEVQYMRWIHITYSSLIVVMVLESCEVTLQKLICMELHLVLGVHHSQCIH